MSLAGKKILVTGASGFIGKHLVRAIAEDGASRIFALSRTPVALAGVESVSVDLADRDAVKAFAQKGDFDVIYNLAGRIDQSTADWIYVEQLKSNALTTINLADAFEGRTGRFIQVGSNSEYGDAPCPQVPDGVTRPCSAYGMSKLAASQSVLSKARSSGFPGVVARPFLVYGRGQGANSFLAKAIESARCGGDFPTSPGGQTRDFTPVSKVVAELVELGVMEETSGRTFNLCTGVELSLREVLTMLVELRPDLIPDFGAVPYRKTELMRSSGVPLWSWSHNKAVSTLREFLSTELIPLESCGR